VQHDYEQMIQQNHMYIYLNTSLYITLHEILFFEQDYSIPISHAVPTTSIINKQNDDIWL
jgi:hypothetical protein